MSPFKRGYDPNRFDLSRGRRSQNPSTAGAEIVRPDVTAQLDRLKHPERSDSAFLSTGGWGGRQADTWGTFKSVSGVGPGEWTKQPKVVLKADDPW